MKIDLSVGLLSRLLQFLYYVAENGDPETFNLAEPEQLAQALTDAIAAASVGVS